MVVLPHIIEYFAGNFKYSNGSVVVVTDRK
jgi:hypothetical protein